MPTKDDHIDTESNVKFRNRIWRDYSAFWILGLCNNYGYVVMLSAAHDIIGRFNPSHESDDGVTVAENGRMCNIISTGAILLADIIPSLIIKSLSPFLPFYINIRILIACLLQTGGFLLVAYATNEWIAILGVILTSFSSGLGETSLLAYSAYFNKNVISTWSSGTGGAGIIGSLSYAGLILLGMTPVNTMLLMLLVPALEAVTFWLLLRRPSTNTRLDINEKFGQNTSSSSPSATTPTAGGTSTTATTNSIDTMCTSQMTFQTTDSCATIANDVDALRYNDDELKPLMSVGAKLRYIPSLLKYMIPLALVYLFEYFINQGLFELVYFPKIWLDKSSQYRWLQVDYQIGVFISRSSVNLFTFKKLWLLAVLQAINVIIFTFEVIYFYMPSIWIVFAVVFWEGLLGGGAYVNTFYRMSSEIPAQRRNFALGIVPISDSIGIALAGFLAMPAHNAICQMPFGR